MWVKNRQNTETFPGNTISPNKNCPWLHIFYIWVQREALFIQDLYSNSFDWKETKSCIFKRHLAVYYCMPAREGIRTPQKKCVYAESERRSHLMEIPDLPPRRPLSHPSRIINPIHFKNLVTLWLFHKCPLLITSQVLYFLALMLHLKLENYLNDFMIMSIFKMMSSPILWKLNESRAL